MSGRGRFATLALLTSLAAVAQDAAPPPQIGPLPAAEPPAAETAPAAPANAPAAPAAAEAAPVVPAEPPPPAAPAEELSPIGVVDAFHRALREGYHEGVLELLAPDVLIYEQGYMERSRDEYASGHLHDDLAFAAVTRRSVVRRESWEEENTAWVLTQSLTTGDFGDKRLELENTETMVLMRDDGPWRIRHIHWSAHPRVPKEGLPPAAEPAPPESPPPPQAPTSQD